MSSKKKKKIHFTIPPFIENHLLIWDDGTVPIYADVRPLVREIFSRTPNGMGYRQVGMVLRAERGIRTYQEDAMRPNPRRANGAARDKIIARHRAIGASCGICGKPIDYSLGYIEAPDGTRRRHPMSFVVDEIIPVSRGGSPISFDNTRAAHWICNARRGVGEEGWAKAPKAIPQPWSI